MGVPVCERSGAVAEGTANGPGSKAQKTQAACLCQQLCGSSTHNRGTTTCPPQQRTNVRVAERQVACLDRHLFCQLLLLLLLLYVRLLLRCRTVGAAALAWRGRGGGRLLLRLQPCEGALCGQLSCHLGGQALGLGVGDRQGHWHHVRRRRRRQATANRGLC